MYTFHFAKYAIIIATFLSPVKGFSQQVIPLYPGVAPGSEGWSWNEQEHFIQAPINGKVAANIARPTLTVFLPDKKISNGVSVLLIPGGGFHFVNIEHEGYKVAKELTAKGYTAFVLKYRVHQTFTDNPLNEGMRALADVDFLKKIEPVKSLATEDALTALRYIKSHASQFNVKENKVGVAGFSAGGALVIRLLKAQNETKLDFVALVYTTFNPQVDTLPGKLPPAFIASASDDKLANPVNSINLYNSWMAAAAPVELHVYAAGGHGLKSGNAPGWVHRFIDWMQFQGF